MEASARVFTAIFILLTIFSPLVSANAVWDFFFGPGKPDEPEPWLRGKDDPNGIAVSIPKSFFADSPASQGPLYQAFYLKTCPKAEKIVSNVVREAACNQSHLATTLLRLHFHDCFVTGCDASILLDKTPSGEKIEKVSQVNANLTIGFEVIDAAKSQLEKECPGVVSCADILTFAARDAAVLSGIPMYAVLGGRHDSNASRLTDVADNIPSSSDKMKQIFIRKGLTLDDMVILLGANSIDRSATSKLDVGFYKQLLENKGLHESDQLLVKDPMIMHLVKKLAANQDLWFKLFAESMIRLGNIRLTTGNRGQIRKQCRSVN